MKIKLGYFGLLFASDWQQDFNNIWQPCKTCDVWYAVIESVSAQQLHLKRSVIYGDFWKGSKTVVLGSQTQSRAPKVELRADSLCLGGVGVSDF